MRRLVTDFSAWAAAAAGAACSCIAGLDTRTSCPCKLLGRLEINEADRAVLTLKTQARKLEQQRQRVSVGSAGSRAWWKAANTHRLSTTHGCPHCHPLLSQQSAASRQSSIPLTLLCERLGILVAGHMQLTADSSCHQRSVFHNRSHPRRSRAMWTGKWASPPRLWHRARRTAPCWRSSARSCRHGRGHAAEGTAARCTG